VVPGVCAATSLLNVISADRSIRGLRAASAFFLVLHLAVVVGAPAADALAHGHEDPHAGSPHLHSPDDDSCPPPHPWACVFCRLARTPVRVSGWAWQVGEAAVDMGLPTAPQAARHKIPTTLPAGARAPPRSDA
jgi:hypothetical protein